jgi:hypothetical protein
MFKSSVISRTLTFFYSDVITLIPLLIALLQPSHETIFVAASTVLQDISSATHGTPPTLTEPLLLWLDSTGMEIIRKHQQSGDTDVDDVTHSLCKLLAAIGEHSTGYFASNISSSKPVKGSTRTKGYLVQLFLQAMLAFSGLPGYFGADEDTSEQALPFWYQLQESLWEDEGEEHGEDESDQAVQQAEAERMNLVKQVYIELVKVLRRKVTFPGPGQQPWAKGGSWNVSLCVD